MTLKGDEPDDDEGEPPLDQKIPPGHCIVNNGSEQDPVEVDLSDTSDEENNEEE